VSTGKNQFLAMCGCWPVGRPRQMQFHFGSSNCPFSDATLIHSLHLSRSSETNKTRNSKVLTVGWTGGELLTAHLGAGRVAGGWMHTSSS
jgi:hypothetical protein